LSTKVDSFISQSIEDSEKVAVDLLIVNGVLVTMSVEGSILEAGAVAVKNGKIKDIGPSVELIDRYIANKIIDARNKIVMPGLVNTHTHVSMTLLRGLADDVPLKIWLEKHIWPAERKYIKSETVVLGAKLAFAEMLRSGTTTFNDMYFFADEIAKAAKQTRIRAVVGEGIMDFPTPSVDNPAEGLRLTEELIVKWQGDPLINIAVAPHSPYTCSEELLRKSKTLSDEYNVPLHIHVAETKQEVEDVLSKTGLSPVAYLNKQNFLRENVIAVHCVHLTRDEINMLADNNVGVAHNPISNAKLASGVAPIPELLKAGVRVGLGTDGAASNNRLDMFKEMSMAALIHKAVNLDPVAVDAYSVLKMATIDAAEVLGMSDKIGSLEKGKHADIILIDTIRPNMRPMYNVFSHLVYAVNSSSVETVIIDGTVVMEENKLLTIDEYSILDEVTRFSENLETGISVA